MRESELPARTGEALPAGAKYARTVAPALVTSSPVTKAISAGNTHSLALRADGSVWAWGLNSEGQLGNGTQTLSNVPLRVTGLPFIKAISAGGSHSLALGVDGTVWVWGQNNFGQLGDGTTTIRRLSPVSVTIPGGAVAIDAGLYHSLAIAADGSVYAWGANLYGQLGDGTTAGPRLTPVRISLPVSIAAISAGWFHSMALGADGRVWTWGRNDKGQIGNGSAPGSNQLSPYQVSLARGATAIAAGANHSLVLLSDQSAVAWGQNANGQLGNGTTAAAQSTPVAVGLAGAVTAIAAGSYFSLAIDSTGAAWGWGDNSSGQLGDGTTTPASRTIPVRVQGLNDALALSAGLFHSLALRPGCPFWAWGVNSSGQLGNGTLTNQLTMTQSQLLNIYFYDLDFDGHGAGLQPSQEACQPSGPNYVENELDCDDFDPAVNPGAAEVCDGLDNNCNGQTDEAGSGTWYRDADGDGYGNAAVSTQACAQPSGYVSNSSDCNDTNASVKPGATEACNGVDDNCNGSIDEGVTQTTWYRDADGDGRGNPSVSTLACSAPAGYVSDSTDCNDTNATLPRFFSRDSDRDGYGDIDVFVVSPVPFGCDPPETGGYSATSDDCNDQRSDVHPGATEMCDGRDNNCNGSVDEGCSCSAWSSSPSVPSGGTATFGFTTSGPFPAGSRAYLYGKKDFVMDTNGSESYDQTTFSFLILNSPGLQGYYQRWVVIRGPDNTDLCTTNSVYVRFLPP